MSDYLTPPGDRASTLPGPAAAAEAGAEEQRSDQGLLRAVAAGDLGLFDPFVDRYQRRLHAFIFRQIGDRQRAEDLLQETFIKAVRAARGGRGPDRPDAAAWMFTIARRVVIDYRRACGARPLVLVGDAARLDPREHDPPETQLSAADDQAVLEKALAGLAEDQREALTLRVYGELTYGQMAEVLGVPEGTLKSRVHAALDRLRRVLIDQKEVLR